MTLPFTIDQFLEVFKNYNLAIWPMHIIAYGLAIAALLPAIKKAPYAGRVIWSVLSFYWLWTGFVYHLFYFAAINPAAYGFGLMFIAQGMLFLWLGVSQCESRFRCVLDGRSVIGAVFILYALLLYPLFGYLAGRGFPQSPSFGVAPCPTTIFTYGILLWADRKVPKYTLVIPALWSVIGFLAAIYLGIGEDTGLLLAGLIAVPLIVFRGREDEAEKGLTHLQKGTKAN